MKSTVIDALPTVLVYEEFHAVRAMPDDDEMWFAAKDVFNALDLPWRGITGLQVIPDAWRGVRTFRTPQNNQYNQQGHREQELIVINFKAVCKVAFRSNKPEADRFTNWAADVIDTIRRTGTYTITKQEPPNAGGERLNANDMSNLRRVIWRICISMPFESQWISMSWKCLRKAAGIGSGEHFTVDHLPFLLQELERLCIASDNVRNVTDRICRKALSQVGYGAALPDITNAMANEATVIKGKADPLKLAAWTEREFQRLAGREPAIMSHPEVNELVEA